MNDRQRLCITAAYQVEPECAHPRTEPRWAVLHDGLGRVIGQSEELTYCTACGVFIPAPEEDL